MLTSSSSPESACELETKKASRSVEFPRPTWFPEIQIDFSHREASASEGIRQSPRGERLTVPTLGPSGTHDRLYCCWKNRLEERPSVRSNNSGGYGCVNVANCSRTRSRRAGIRSAPRCTAQSHAAQNGPSMTSVDCSISPPCEAGKSSARSSFRRSRAGSPQPLPCGNWWRHTYLTRNFTSVLGIEQLGLYMLIWSPL